MRGALLVKLRGIDVFGIIPADAGSTSYPINKMMLDEGSSPRMRGAPGLPDPPLL